MPYICKIKRTKFILLFAAGFIILLHNVNAHQHLSNTILLSHTLHAEKQNSLSLIDLLLQSDTGGGHLENFSRSDVHLAQAFQVEQVPIIFDFSFQLEPYLLSETENSTLPEYLVHFLSEPPNLANTLRGPPQIG